MRYKDIIEKIDARPLVAHNYTLFNREYEYVFAADLMSDALAMINKDAEKTILVTGLVNAQSIRTADMLGISTIIYVRDKVPTSYEVELARMNNFNIFSTKYTMYECCGLLYELGLKATDYVNDLL